MSTFKLIISTPTQDTYETEVQELCVRGSEGLLTVCAGHIPFITSVIAGNIRITTPEGDELTATVSDGILTVTAEKTTLLCGKFELDK